MPSTVVSSRLPIDLALTFAPLRRGTGDPTMRADASGTWWRATRTPLGAATTSFTPLDSARVRVEAWGPGAEWALDAAPDIVGANDSLDGFSPRGKLGEIHRRLAGLRVPRTRAVFEAAFASVLEQMVSGKEAHASHRQITRAWSEAAPGPADPPLVLPPAPTALARRASFELRPFGVEMKRAGALRAIAVRAERLEETLSMSAADARRRLEAVPGIGPWTAAEVAFVALGDADAVSLGDDGLPHTVTYAFTGEPRGNDAKMLELLAPFAGHRGRVVRLLYAAGISAPRFGARHRIRPRYA